MESQVTVENQCHVSHIDAVFQPIIEDAVAVYQSIFGAAIVNIRLMGSVARGEDCSRSDIDFIAVLDRDLASEELQQLESEEAAMRGRHPVVNRVDLEAVPANGLHDFRRFVFATDSLSLFGTDLYTTPSQIWDRTELMHLVTPDLPELVRSYRNAVESTDEGDVERLRFYSRIIGKDFLKCYRRVALERGGAYERNIGRIYQQLLHYLPERRLLLDELYDFYSHPGDDKQRLLQVLDESRDLNQD